MVKDVFAQMRNSEDLQVDDRRKLVWMGPEPVWVNGTVTYLPSH